MFKKIVLISLVCSSSLMVNAQSFRNNISLKDTITDKDIVVPMDIERNFDQLLLDWRKEYNVSPSCASYSDTDVAYPDSVYIERLYSLPTEMELVYNPIVRSYINMYTGRMRGSVEYFIGKSKYFFPIFEQALDKYDLPIELKYLPIIESALNPVIVSRAGATGLWQFMIGTGKMYNLEINSLVDERRDPLKSSEAAAKYLKDLYNIYGDWNLVIAAYNCGPGNVNKAIKRSGGETDYWSIYPYLPKETRGYVPAFIAATYVMNYYENHNICPFEFKYTHSTDTVAVDQYVHLQQIADVLDVSIDELRNLNPQYKKDIVPGEFKSYLVTLPSIKATEFEVSKDSVYSYKTNEFLSHRKVVEPKGYSSAGNGLKYKVRRGDNLASIAKRNGVTMNQLRYWNNLKSSSLRVGQYLMVSNPVKSTSQQEDSGNDLVAENNKEIKEPQTNSNASDNQSSGSDVLAEYFEKQQHNNKTVEEDADSTELIDPVVKQSRMNDLQNSQTIYHKVRIGETLTQIATKYDVDKDQIVKWNKLKKSVPKVGQRLVIHLPKKENINKLDMPTISPESVEDVISDSKLLADNKTSEAELASVAPAMNKINNVQRNEEATPIPRAQNNKSKAEPKMKAPAIYVVKKGDTLGHIALKYGGKVTASSIRKMNNLKSDNLSIGQKLKIPR